MPEFPKIPFEPKVQNKEGQLLIFCEIRKKYIILSAEEWVRQMTLAWLLQSYPRALIRVEKALKYYKNTKRADIIISDRKGSIFMIIECKSMKNELDKKALNQAAIYNYSLKAPFIMVTNGKLYHLFSIDLTAGSYREIIGLPPMI